MIGIMRFHGSSRPIERPGHDGLAVEIGYRVFLTHRSNGYATEVVQAMMDWSRLHYGINKYLASVSPDNLISNRLISSFGFIKVGEINDETDGIEFVFLKET